MIGPDDVVVDNVGVVECDVVEVVEVFSNGITLLARAAIVGQQFDVKKLSPAMDIRRVLSVAAPAIGRQQAADIKT